MSIVRDFLREHSERLSLESFGLDENLISLVVTPRFQASRHVIFLILAKEAAEPALVAKLPRMQESAGLIEREAESLRRVHTLKSGGFQTIPRVVLFERHRGIPILVQTALRGSPLDPQRMRGSLESSCRKIVSFLLELAPDQSSEVPETSGFERLIAEPLQEFSQAFDADPEEKSLLERTRELVATLATAPLRAVFEHGDLSHPNLFLLRDGAVGVIDWEMSEPRGIVSHDLFFFLSYAAFSADAARTPPEQVRAFERAFFGKNAWARPYVEEYSRGVRLDASLLTPLFIACWARRIATLYSRLLEDDQRLTPADAARWLRRNRYYFLWRQSIDRYADLCWSMT